MSENAHHHDETVCADLKSEWNFVVQYRAGYSGTNTIAYRHALIKAKSIDSETNIRCYRKDGYTYWEVWERK